MNTKSALLSMDSILRPAGFVRRKMTWNRKSDPYCDVVDLQLSQAGDSLTINAGVMHEYVYSMCWESPPPAFIEEPLCTVRTRIGQLVGDKDIWWPNTQENAVDEMTDHIRTCVFPFLDQMHSNEAMLGHLTDANVVRQKYPPPIIYLGILRWISGDAESARVVLEALRNQTTEPWKSRVGKIVSKLN